MVYYKYYVFNTLKGNCVSIIVYLIYLQIFFFFGCYLLFTFWPFDNNNNYNNN